MQYQFEQIIFSRLLSTVFIAQPDAIGCLWQHGNGQALVAFSGGKVQQKRWFDRQGTIFEKVRQWLGLDTDEPSWPVL